MLFDYSRDGTLRSVEASLKRLRLDYLDIVLIHDVIRHFHGEDGVHDRFIEARDGAIPALQQLRDEGIVRAIGCGLKDVDIAARFIDEAEIDVVVLPGRLTLLDQSAITSGLADLCLKHGVALIPAAPFDSGILATGAIAGASYGYKPAEAAVITRVTAMEQLCLEHGVPIQAAALQYPKRHPAVASVLCGMRTLAHVSENVAWMEMPIPTELWTALRRETGLILPD